MKWGRLVMPFIAVIALAVAIETYVAQDLKSRGRGPASQVRESSKVPDPEPDKASSIRNTLAALLADARVHVGTSLPTWAGRSYKEIRVRWQGTAVAEPGPKLLLKEAGPGIVTLLASEAKDGTLPRARSLELSTNQILALALDEKGNLLWWNLMLDPRMVRAEAPASRGEMRSEELYLSEVDFSIAYPNDPAISEVRLYHPQWNGKYFRLELISSLLLK